MGKVCDVCLGVILIPLIALVSLHSMYIPKSKIVQLAIFHGRATIIYDSEYGIPYINGTSNNAVSYAMGYAHAEDRLYHLNVRRALMKGRLAEVIFIKE